MNFLPKILKAILLGAVLGIFVSYLSVQAQQLGEQWSNWIDPPPASNTSAPIHTGSDQVKPGPLALNNLMVDSVAAFIGNITIGFPSEVIAVREAQLIAQGVTGTNLTNTLQQEFGSTLTIMGEAYIGLGGDPNDPDPNDPDPLVARDFELNEDSGVTIVEQNVISKDGLFPVLVSFEAENGVTTQNLEFPGVVLGGSNMQDARCRTLCFDGNNIVSCSKAGLPYADAC